MRRVRVERGVEGIRRAGRHRAAFDVASWLPQIGVAILDVIRDAARPMIAGMDLVGDTSIWMVSNTDRCRAALSVCEILDDSQRAAEPLLILGLVQPGVRGLEPTLDRQGRPWTCELDSVRGRSHQSP